MKIRYDKEADAAYIYLKNITPGEASYTYCCDPKEINGMINLDFNSEGLLIGIEVLGASKRLPVDLLTDAEKIG